MRLYFLLDPITHTTTATDDLDLATQQWEQPHRVIGHDTINGVLVSTVFLVINHNHAGIGAPVLFETMIFGHDEDHELARLSGYEDYQVRYETWDQALAGHQAAVYAIQNKLEAP